VDGGIHEALHGESYVFGGKGSAVGKVHAMAQLEGDLPAVGRDFPGLGEFGLEFLGVTVDAGENASGEVTDGESGVVIDEKRIEGLGFGADAEAQFAARLGEGGGEQDEADEEGRDSSLCSE
jgi:hypothetical protein